MGLKAVLEAGLQRRRLLLAAAGLRLFGTGGSVAGYAAYVLAARAEDGTAPLPGPSISAGASAGRRQWRDPARLAALQVEVSAQAAVWFAAGIRLVTPADLCDERDAVLALGDATPPLLWVQAAAWTPAFVAALAGRPRLAALHSRKSREMHGGVPWIAATPAALKAWAAASGAAVQREAASAPFLIGGRQTRWEQLVRAAADRLGWPCIDVLAGGLPAARGVDSDGFAPALLTVALEGPVVDETAGGARARPAAAALQRRDDLILALANRALALDLRAGGNWHRRLQTALGAAPVPASPEFSGTRVWVVAGGGGDNRVVDDLIAKGAGRLAVESGGVLAQPAPLRQVADAAGVARVATLPTASDGDWPYLIHWTRRPEGPWPAESTAAWLGRLLPAAGAAPACMTAPTAADALLRIVTQRRIVGGRQFLRSGPAVCFSQWPPAWMARVAAEAGRHRGLNRPRYELYGIALRREFLLELGAAPVIYGGEADYAALAAEDRFRFQLEGPQTERWSREGEWRLPGDLDFAEADSVDFFLLAPDLEAAAVLAEALGDRTIRVAAVGKSE